MNILEAIKQRRSVRSYNGRGLTPEEIDQLKGAIAGSYSPFGGDVTIRLNSFELKGEYRPGTYGVIRGASDYFLLAYSDDEESVLSAGFRFEQVVLQATAMGLGTCWIGGTFRGSDFDKGQVWPDGEKLKIVSPVGEAAGKSLRESLTRFVMRSQNRKPFQSLFFKGDFSTGLNQDDDFGEPLEMMRLAPSSVNSQPWRALVTDHTVHFYYLRKSRLSLLDAAIGMSHFFETERYNGHRGDFFKDVNPPEAPKGWHYIRSYRRDNVI
ncbi:MAG: nitroreductase [Barnesiella sp.]|nr:nitroreductase [Barnesiella sp.]